MDAVTVVMCTAPEAEAPAMADQLLRENLVACVNLVGPVVSRYWWQGQIESGKEILLLMKTARESVQQLRQRVAELHSYDVPEILEFHADAGLPAYLAWVTGVCKG